jgi:nitrogen regulatory protein A
MGDVREQVEVKLEYMRELTSSDFSAIAWQDIHGDCIRWKYTSGNSNERYKQIVIKKGRGVTGSAILLGRPIVLDSTIFDAERLRYENPIMLAEQLQSILAVPLMVSGEMRGGLLIGSRSRRIYTQNEIRIVTSFAERFVALMEQEDHNFT